MRALSCTRRTMWSKPLIEMGLGIAIGLLMRPEIGAESSEQKTEDAAVASFAVLEDVAAQQAFLLEAQLLQQGLGAPVAQVGAGGELAQPAGGGEGHDRGHGLQRIALAPGLATQHEAHLGAAVPAVDLGEVATAEELARSQRAH